MALGVQIKPTQHAVGVLACIIDIVTMQQRADNDILLHGQRGEWPHDLECAADTAPADLVRGETFDALPGKCNASGVRREHSGDHIKERRLTGTVRPDHRKDLTVSDVKSHTVDRQQAPELLGNSVD